MIDAETALERAVEHRRRGGRAANHRRPSRQRRRDRVDQRRQDLRRFGDRRADDHARRQRTIETDSRRRSRGSPSSTTNADPLCASSARSRRAIGRRCATGRTPRAARRSDAAAGRTARGRTVGRQQLLGQQIGRDVAHRVTETRVKAERVGIEAVLEESHALAAPASAGGSDSISARPTPRGAPGRAAIGPMLATGAAPVREADPDARTRSARQGAAVGVQIEVGTAQPGCALDVRERRGVPALAIDRREGFVQQARGVVDVARRAWSAHVDSHATAQVGAPDGRGSRRRRGASRSLAFTRNPGGGRSKLASPSTSANSRTVGGHRRQVTRPRRTAPWIET